MINSFLKYITKAPEFNDEEHRKAWLIKVSANISKNMLMFRLNRDTVNIDEVESIGINCSDFETFELIMSLPSKHKIVLEQCNSSRRHTSRKVSL